MSSDADATHSSTNGLKCRSMTVPLWPVQSGTCWGRRPVLLRGHTTKGPPPPRHGRQTYLELASTRLESGAEALHCTANTRSAGQRACARAHARMPGRPRPGKRAAAAGRTAACVPAACGRRTGAYGCRPGRFRTGPPCARSCQRRAGTWRSARPQPWSARCAARLTVQRAACAFCAAARRDGSGRACAPVTHGRSSACGLLALTSRQSTALKLFSFFFVRAPNSSPTVFWPREE